MIIGRAIRLFTPDNYSYQRVGFSSFYATSVIFKVQACNDAHVGLFEVLDTSGKFPYEIVFGGSKNQWTYIRNQSLISNVASARTPNILDCSKFKTLWVSWRGGFIEAGVGAIVGDNKVIDWQDPQPRGIHYVGISTGWGSTGLWEFSDYKGG